MEDFDGMEQAGRPKMVVLAGPNGSGKSTVTRGLMEDPHFPKDRYVNADDIAKRLEQPIEDAETRRRYAAVIEPNMPELPLVGKIWYMGSRMSEEQIATELGRGVSNVDQRNGFAAILADDARKAELRGGHDFAFETVMSTQGKLAMFDEARGKGYDVDMVFVTTESSLINQQRVLNRVAQGGHAVDPDKIAERYNRAMHMLPAALQMVETASVYDNSFHTPVLIAKKERGEIVFPEVTMPTMEDMQKRPELRKEGPLGAWYVSSMWQSDWAEAREGITGLQNRIRENVQAQQHDFDTLHDRYAKADKPMARADIQNGSETAGRVVEVTDRHVLQFDRENNRYVAHDRTLLTPGVIANLQEAQVSGKDVTIAYNYGPDSKLVDQNKTLNKTPELTQASLDQYLFDPSSREEPKPRQL